jgi:predicted lipoprotein with Yx(FWY)xxD motif
MITRKRLPLYVAGGAGVSALAVVVGLTLGNSQATGSSVSTTPSSTVVTTRDTPLGRILVDSQGRTLYLFAKDSGPASTCSGSCLSYWPAVPVTGQPQATGGATAASIAVITGSQGSRQLSYAGHPLYYFAGDKQPGQTSGQGLDQFGAKWFVLGPSGAVVTTVSSGAGGTSSGGGYGY